MQFIKTSRGLVNLAFVESIERASDGKSIVNYEGGPASSETLFEDFYYIIGEVVPNTTGAQALFMNVDGDEVHHWTSPIIAWRVTEKDAAPIVAGGDQCQYVLLPSGQVDELYMGLFDTIDEAKSDFMKRNKS